MKLSSPKLEKYKVKDHIVTVIREDLTNPFPLPNNSKIRGIISKLEALREQGVKTVASQDTSISRIGWGVSAIAKELDMTHYNFYPAKKTMNFYQQMSKSFGGQMVPIHGTFASAFRELSKRWMVKNNVNAHFLPVGVSMKEAVLANAEIVSEFFPDDYGLMNDGSIVTCVSSGTICAGIYYGLMKANCTATLYGVTSSSFKNRKEKILKKVRDADQQFWCDMKFDDRKLSRLEIVDQGYEYKEIEPLEPPFPCDLYLDRKAWKYLVDNIDNLPEPIFFWNIGGEFSPEYGLTGNLRGDGIVTKEIIDKYLGEITC